MPSIVYECWIIEYDVLVGKDSNVARCMLQRDIRFIVMQHRVRHTAANIIGGFRNEDAVVVGCGGGAWQCAVSSTPPL
jgi:hypothetical protein